MKIKESVADWLTHKKKSNGEAEASAKLDIPKELWTKCPTCNETIYHKDLEPNLKVCPKCGYHFRLTARERIAITLDEGSFQETDPNLRSLDPLHFNDVIPYAQRIVEASKKSGLNDAIVTGTGTIERYPLVVAVMDFHFMGGSMGSVVGEKISRAAEKALELKQPLLIVTASGGARMQEGILSLMQMAKTSAALAQLQQASLATICLLTDPTTGGTTASYAMLGDYTLAEPGALIGFAGPRVIEQTIRQKLPAGFQRSEYLQDHGMVDLVVERKDIRTTLINILAFCSSRPEEETAS